MWYNAKQIDVEFEEVAKHIAKVLKIELVKLTAQKQLRLAIRLVFAILWRLQIINQSVVIEK